MPSRVMFVIKRICLSGTGPIQLRGEGEGLVKPPSRGPPLLALDTPLLVRASGHGVPPANSV